MNRFIKNCCEDEEHKLKGGLTLSELSDAEEQIIRVAKGRAFLKFYHIMFDILLFYHANIGLQNLLLNIIMKKGTIIQEQTKHCLCYQPNIGS